MWTVTVLTAIRGLHLHMSTVPKFIQECLCFYNLSDWYTYTLKESVVRYIPETFGSTGH